MTIARKIYNAVTSVAAPLALPAFLLSPRGRKRISERYGNWKDIPEKAIWFHGASLGEVNGLLPLMRRIGEALPASPTILSATSPTGLEVDAPADQKYILPLDAGWCLRKILNNWTPERFIIAETELWPNLLYALAEKKVPLHLVNARISDFTFDRYKIVSALFPGMMKLFCSISAVTQEARDRFIALGADPERVKVTGHMKYDSSVKLYPEEERAALYRKLFPDIIEKEPVLVLGSIRPGEEKFWFPEISEIFQRNLPLRVVVAPRHSERFEYFRRAINEQGWRFACWTDSGSSERSSKVFLLDTIGELARVYAISDMAFVGATLVNIGGHNPLEPAAYGASVVTGPHIQNIRDIVQDMKQSGCIMQVKSREDVRRVLNELTANLKEVANRAAAAKLVAESHRGATDRVLEHLKERSKR